MIAVLLIAAGVVPSLLLMRHFRARGLRRRAPRGVVWITFGLGALAVLPAALLAAPSGTLGSRIADPLAYGLFGALFTAAVPEETLKLLVLTRYSMRRLDLPIQGIIYGVSVALGFATLENVVCLVREGGGVAAVRALTGVPGHAFFGAIMGYYIGRAKVATSGAHGLIAKGSLIAIGLHAAYDFPFLVTAHLKRAGAAYAGEKPAAMALMLLSPLVLACSGVAAVWLVWLDGKFRAEPRALPIVPSPPIAPSPES